MKTLTQKDRNGCCRSSESEIDRRSRTLQRTGEVEMIESVSVGEGLGKKFNARAREGEA